MKNWKAEELKMLTELHPSMSNVELAKHFNRTLHSIEMKACRMGLYKDEENNVAARVRQRRQQQSKLGTWQTLKRLDGTTLDCTVEIVNGVRITRAKTVLDPRYTPTGPYVGAITGEVRHA